MSAPLITTPYTYLLKHKPTGHVYYGVRWARGCHPDEFWKTYFTSSKKLIPLYRTIYGDDCWEFEIRRTFMTAKVAQEWEHKVLRRLKVLKKPELWLNRTNNRAILNDEISTKLGQEKRIRTIKNTGCLAGANNGAYGKPASPLCRLMVSRNMSKSIWITNGEENRRIFDGVIPDGWSRGRNLQHDLDGRFVW